MNIRPDRGIIDHLLALIACVMASYSIAISVNKPQLALFMAVIVGLSCLAGYGLSNSVEGTKLAKADGWIFAFAAIIAVSLTPRVNAALPEEGFPWQIIASVMMWLVMVAGALFSWSDGTLLFLSLPGIALFGLVGVINDAAGILFPFCVFLVSVAVLYARVHQRSMLVEAERSGADVRLLWRDAWKWMAGPEWAFAAAGVIIFLSFFASPVLQFSLKGVSQNIGRGVSDSFTRAARARTAAVDNQPDTAIGRGPVALDDTVVFQAQLDKPRYLRTQVFTAYTGKGWSSEEKDWSPALEAASGSMKMETDLLVRDLSNLEGAHVEQFAIKKRVTPSSSVFVAPGYVIAGPNVGNYQRRSGIVSFGFTDPNNNVYAGQSIVTDRDAMPAVYDARAIQFATSTLNIPRSVADLALKVTEGTTDPIERAQRIKSEIESRAKYNLEAAPTPLNTDPVEHFLFTQKEGYCDLFASSMALMARSAGLPSRYVIGYLINDTDKDADGFYSIRNRDYHAWCEVFVDGYGWIPFDATEGAEQVAGNERGSTTNAWEQFVRNVDWQVVSRIAFAILAAVTGFIFLKTFRRAAPTSDSGVRGEVVHIQNRFQKGLETFYRHPRRFSQTILEYVGVLNPSLAQLGPEAKDLAEKLQAAQFGRDEISKDEVKALRSQTKDFVGKLKQIPRPKR